jgi:hypothetical protein
VEHVVSLQFVIFHIFLFLNDCTHYLYVLLLLRCMCMARYRLPLDVLKNFSHSMISVVFVFDAQSISAELEALHASDAGMPVDAAAVTAACITACELVIKDAHLAGCSTLSLSCSEWTRKLADPAVSDYLALCCCCSLDYWYCYSKCSSCSHLSCI